MIDRELLHGRWQRKQKIMFTKWNTAIEVEMQLELESQSGLIFGGDCLH